MSRKVLPIGVAAVAVILSAIGSPAQASTPSGTGVSTGPASSDVIDQSDPGGRQLNLTDFKGWILDRPGIETSGYIESVNNAANQSTVLLWKGSSPLQAAIIAEGAHRGIAVTVQHRKYDLNQINTAERDVYANASTVPDFTISSVVGVVADYDGITIEGQYTAAASARMAAAMASVQAFADTAAAQTGVAVRVTNGQPTVPASTRSKDVAPYNAGGYMIGTDTNAGKRRTCSTGFAISVGGVHRTTTARHCWYHDFTARDSTADYGDGVVNSADGAGREMSTGGFYWMFDGAWNDASGYHKTVTGNGAVSLGDHVCTSGGNSGVHCNINLDQTGVMLNDGFGLVSNIRGNQLTSGAIAAIQGDSGGPVLVTAGTGKVHAVGMIQFVDGTRITNCGPVHDAGENICSPHVFFTLMSVIIRNISGASLVTG